MVHFQQTIFSLPDLAKMQIKVKVHESVVKKVGFVPFDVSAAGVRPRP